MATVKALKQINSVDKIYEVGTEFEMNDKKAEFHALKGNVEILTKELKQESVKTKELKIEATTK